MILDIHEDTPPIDKEIYIIVVKKAYIHEAKDGRTIWCVMNEDFPLGYIDEDAEILECMPNKIEEKNE